jgi:shikimate dehydrogenase
MITANSKVCGLIANPIGHSISPLLQNSLSQKMGMDMVYVPLPVTDNLKDAVSGAYALGIEGINVTIPYKQDVMKFLTGLDQAASDIGAVNTLVRGMAGYRGYNTDLPGLRKAVASAKIDLKGKDVLLLGAGGAAKAAACLAALSGAASLTVLNRTADRAESLCAVLRKTYPAFHAVSGRTEDWKDLKGKDYVVFQSTSVGMFPHGSDCLITDRRFYEKCAAGIDLIYTPSETVFLKNMKKAGAVTLGGLKMLLAQGVLSWELWNPGIRVTEQTENEVYEILSDELKKREKMP